MLSLDIAFHKTHTPGELIERVDGDVTTLAGFFSQFVAQVGTSLVLIAGVLIVLFAEGWLSGLVGLGSFVLSGAAVLSVSSLTVKAWACIRASTTEMMSFVEEHIAGREEVKALGADPAVVRRLTALSTRHWRLRRRARFLESAASNVTVDAWMLGQFAMLVLAFFLYRGGALSLGTAMMLFFYVDLLNEPITTIREQMDELQRARAALGRLVSLTSVTPAIADGAGGALPHGPLSVTLDRVCFRLRGGSPGAAQRLASTWRPGTVLGLLGRTGSGKTTLTRLLLPPLRPAGGQRPAGRRGHAPARRCDDLRGRVGLVTQEVQLFHGHACATT